MPLLDATAAPTEFRDVTLHVFSVKIAGTFKTQIKNTGALPLLNTNFSMANVKAGGFLITPKISAFLGRVGRNQLITINWKWEVSGVLDVLWQLIRAFLTGTIKAEATFTITAMGFSKSIKANVVVPARNINTEWN